MKFTVGQFSEFMIFLMEKTRSERREILHGRSKAKHLLHNLCSRHLSELDFGDAADRNPLYYLLGTDYRAGHHAVSIFYHSNTL